MTVARPPRCPPRILIPGSHPTHPYVFFFTIFTPDSPCFFFAGGASVGFVATVEADAPKGFSVGTAPWKGRMGGAVADDVRDDMDGRPRSPCRPVVGLEGAGRACEIVEDGDPKEDVGEGLCVVCREPSPFVAFACTGRCCVGCIDVSPTVSRGAITLSNVGGGFAGNDGCKGSG